MHLSSVQFYIVILLATLGILWALRTYLEDILNKLNIRSFDDGKNLYFETVIDGQ